MVPGSASPFRKTTIEIHAGRDHLPIAALANYPAGEYPDIIWLHANGFNARTYAHMLGPLTGALRVLAVDQRGHGGTPQQRPADGKLDALDMRDDVIALLEALAAPGPVVLAGHSMGGCVSILAAAERPAQVRALALFDPVILSRERADEILRRGAPVESPLVAKARSRRRRFPSRDAVLETYVGRSIFATWPVEAVRGYVDDGFRDLPDGSVELACAPEWEAANFAAHGHDIWDAMSRVRAPIRIWRAEHGTTCAIGDAAEFPRPAGQVKVETVAGATHFLPIERPELVKAALVGLFADLRT